MGMSTAYKDKASPVTDEESIATIHTALELGVTFLDTSDMYGPFTNEELVGGYLQLRLSSCSYVSCSSFTTTKLLDLLCGYQMINHHWIH
jgi:aryl-alcohol dehydrogenase-like predicted oxidoreductase